MLPATMSTIIETQKKTINKLRDENTDLKLEQLDLNDRIVALEAEVQKLQSSGSQVEPHMGKIEVYQAHTHTELVWRPSPMWTPAKKRKTASHRGSATPLVSAVPAAGVSTAATVVERVWTHPVITIPFVTTQNGCWSFFFFSMAYVRRTSSGLMSASARHPPLHRRQIVPAEFPAATSKRATLRYPA